MDEIFFFKLHVHACWKCPFLQHFLQIAPFTEHTSMPWLGLFPHLEQFICLDWPLPLPVSDIFLPSLLNVFTVSIGDCLVSSPREKLVAGDPVPTAKYMSYIALSRVRSPSSNCSRSDNLLSWMPATSIYLIISSSRAPKLQCLMKDATDSPFSCLLWKKLIWSKTVFLFFMKYNSNLPLTVTYDFCSPSDSRKDSRMSSASSPVVYERKPAFPDHLNQDSKQSYSAWTFLLN